MRIVKGILSLIILAAVFVLSLLVMKLNFVVGLFFCLTIGGDIALMMCTDLANKVDGNDIKVWTLKNLFGMSSWIGFFERMIIFAAFWTHQIIALTIIIVVTELIISSKNDKAGVDKMIFQTFFNISFVIIIFYLISHFFFNDSQITEGIVNRVFPIIRNFFL